MKTALFALLFVAAFPTSAAFKCVDANGKTAFQDFPCAAQATESRVRIQQVADAPPENPNKTPAYRAVGDRLEAERLLRENMRAISMQQGACDDEQRNIMGKQVYSRNNLAGATRDQAIASEAQVASTRCDARSRQLLVERDDLRKLCAERGCTPAVN